jgi:hypothetical protein
VRRSPEQRLIISSIDEVTMQTKRSSVLYASSAALFGLSLSCGAAAAQSCGAVVEAVKVEWRSLTHGSHNVAPAMRISTSDGRHLTGSQLNYAWVLIDRAESACGAGGDAAAMVHIHELETLLHPL